MKKLLTITIGIAIIFAGVALAGDTAEKADKADKAEKATTAKKVSSPDELKKQTHCPVMGGKIDSTVYTDIQGQRVYHCCPGCSEPLMENPDKYFKKAAAEGILFENIQETDPICGMKPVKDFFLYHEGRGLYFCNEGCKVRFAETPDKYMSKLTPVAEKKKEDHDHGHDHDHDHEGHSH